jgi:hypothetical protein
MKINIQDCDKAEVLAALFNNSFQQGLGVLHSNGSNDMTTEEARACLKAGDDQMFSNRGYFDYMKGRVMKVDLAGEEFCPARYDRDNGPGAAQRALNNVTGVRVIDA